jgi:cytidyltransferase-like protein
MIVAIAGKFDPPHEGHIDHIVKASKLGDYLYVITHPDDVVARTSAKGYCAITLPVRIAILDALLRYFGINGKTVMAIDKDGTVVETLRSLKPHIFAKGGDRVPGNIPSGEVVVCGDIGCKIEYGIGNLLNSSSTLMEK